MPETMTPMQTTESHAVVQTPSAAHNPTGGRAASGALNIVRKKPIEGTPSADALAPGVAPSPSHDLVFSGGKTIRDLTYQNLYVGGSAAWSASDIQNIDRALAAAMSDTRLNTVLSQYFNGQTVTTQTAASIMLPGPKPKTVSRTSVGKMVQKYIVAAGLLQRFNPAATVFNFLLPPGVILTTTGGAGGANTTGEDSSADTPTVTTVTTIRSGETVTTVTIATTQGGSTIVSDGDGTGSDHPLGMEPDDAASSLAGLGGYHGSVHVAGTVVYFAVGVYSQILPNGRENGIAAFDQPWKNVVGTFYHEMQEVRTDADVEDAIRTNNQNFIGWGSAQGEEIGDFPVFEASPLSQVFKEVPLLTGGTAPIQLLYSNRVHGPEDPTI